jgi:hypothetical protein
MHITSTLDAARDLVLRYRADDVGSARLEIGKVTVHMDEQRGAPVVTVSWPGCGERAVAFTTAFAADVTRAAEIATAAEHLLSSGSL